MGPAGAAPVGKIERDMLRELLAKIYLSPINANFTDQFLPDRGQEPVQGRGVGQVNIFRKPVIGIVHRVVGGCFRQKRDPIFLAPDQIIIFCPKHLLGLRPGFRIA